jgi:NitT/TauT family transport system substrate-binding protein
VLSEARGRSQGNRRLLCSRHKHVAGYSPRSPLPRPPASWGARGYRPKSPPETTTVRLAKIPGICVAPQYVAEDLLRSEGFNSVQYVELLSANVYDAFTASTIDISMAFIAPYIIQMDAGAPLVLLGGVHAGCFELFGTDRVKAVRDLRGKTLAVPELGSPHHVFAAAMASHVGIDPKREINFVTRPPRPSRCSSSRTARSTP